MRQSLHFVTEIYLTPLSFMFSKVNAFFTHPLPLYLLVAVSLFFFCASMSVSILFFHLFCFLLNYYKEGIIVAPL